MTASGRGRVITRAREVDKCADKSDRVSRPDRRDQRAHSEHLDHPLQVICQYMQAQLGSDFW